MRPQIALPYRRGISSRSKYRFPSMRRGTGTERTTRCQADSDTSGESGTLRFALLANRFPRALLIAPHFRVLSRELQEQAIILHRLIVLAQPIVVARTQIEQPREVERRQGTRSGGRRNRRRAYERGNPVPFARFDHRP